MARTSGTYSPPNGSWSSGAVNGALATVADWQALLADISAALTQSVSKDGQTTITGNLNMGGNALTSLAAGVGAGQSLRFEQLFSQGVETDLASAATTDIGLQNTNFLRVTGTTTITSFGTNYNGPRFLRFAGALTLTNSATLILPGAADITTVAGDTLIAIPKATTGTADGWQVVAYQKTSSLIPVTSGTATVPLTNVNVTLTGSQAAFPVITFTGTLTGNVNVIFPNDVKSYRILNNTTGAFTITCKTASGSGVVVAAGSSDIFCDGTNITTTSISSAQITSKIQPILATVASNALTITLNPTTLDFRSTTLGSGAVSTVTLGSAVTLVVPTLATLGTVSAQQSRLVVLAINNAGTIETAVVNIAGGNDLSETGLISTTAISGSATANNVIYSTTARTSVAYRVVGYVESTQATAGTWATAPSTVQGAGGNNRISSASMIRLNGSNGYGSTNTKIRRFSTVVTNQGNDIAYADSATLGASFTINSAGVYGISFSESFSGEGWNGISLNTTQPTIAIQSSTVPNSEVLALAYIPTSGNMNVSVSAIYLPVGSIIRPHNSGQGSSLTSPNSSFTVTRIF